MKLDVDKARVLIVSPMIEMQAGGRCLRERASTPPVA